MDDPLVGLFTLGSVEKENLAHARFVEEHNSRLPATLEPREGMVGIPGETAPAARILQNRCFLVRVYQHEGATRLTINRTTMTAEGRIDNSPIGREELQQLKAEAGYADRWAVEVFPPESEVVTHKGPCKFRHLWLAEKPAWINSPGK